MSRLPAHRRAASLIYAALTVAMVGSLLVGSAPVRAQGTEPVAAESQEEATVFLQSYRLPSDVLPAGYAHMSDSAATNATQAFDLVTSEGDPRPAEQIL